MDDPYRLERFVQAQDRHGAYQRALEEITRGEKDSHWIWYVFPQLAGLGSSPMSREYAISSIEEARAYLRHPLLGPRLHEITTAATSHVDKSARDIFRFDDVKFRSSMTLFMRAAADDPLFRHAVELFFAGEPDGKTDGLLRGNGPPSAVEG